MAKENFFFFIVGTESDSRMTYRADSSEELNFVLDDVLENLEIGEVIEIHDGNNEVRNITRK